MNGDFEIFNKVPVKLYSNFNSMPFWNDDISLNCVYSRDAKTREYYKDDGTYIAGLNNGTPDIITNEIFIKYENEKIIQKNACARIHCYNIKHANSNSTVGEYLYTKLKKTLVKGHTYQLTVSIMLSQISSYTANNFGAIFSDCAVNIGDTPYFEKKLHTADIVLYDEYFLTKEEGWIKVSAKYVAKGGEQYLTLGCFDSGKSKYWAKPVKSIGNYRSTSPFVYLDDTKLIEVNE